MKAVSLVRRVAQTMTTYLLVTTLGCSTMRSKPYEKYTPPPKTEVQEGVLQGSLEGKVRACVMDFVEDNWPEMIKHVKTKKKNENKELRVGYRIEGDERKVFLFFDENRNDKFDDVDTDYRIKLNKTTKDSTTTLCTDDLPVVQKITGVRNDGETVLVQRMIGTNISHTTYKELEPLEYAKANVNFGCKLQGETPDFVKNRVPVLYLGKEVGKPNKSWFVIYYPSKDFYNGLADEIEKGPKKDMYIRRVMPGECGMQRENAEGRVQNGNGKKEQRLKGNKKVTCFSHVGSHLEKFGYEVNWVGKVFYQVVDDRISLQICNDLEPVTQKRASQKQYR